MTTTYSEWTKQIGDQWVAAITRVEQGASLAAQTLSDASASTSLPSAAELPLIEQVLSLQEAFVSQLPSPEEVVRANFELTARVVEAHYEFALSVFSFGGSREASRVTPRTPAAAKPAPAEPGPAESAAAKPAAKPTKRTGSAAAKPTAKPTTAAAKPAAKTVKRAGSAAAKLAAKTTTSTPAAATPAGAPKGTAPAVADQPTVEGAASKE